MDWQKHKTSFLHQEHPEHLTVGRRLHDFYLPLIQMENVRECSGVKSVREIAVEGEAGSRRGGTGSEPGAQFPVIFVLCEVMWGNGTPNYLTRTFREKQCTWILGKKKNRESFGTMSRGSRKVGEPQTLRKVMLVFTPFNDKELFGLADQENRTPWVKIHFAEPPLQGWRPPLLSWGNICVGSEGFQNSSPHPPERTAGLLLRSTQKRAARAGRKEKVTIQ